MKLIKKANGKTIIKISKVEWIKIGEEQEWGVMPNNYEARIDKLERMVASQGKMLRNLHSTISALTPGNTEKTIR